MTKALRFRDIQDQIAHAPTVFVVSDFDGTLCPIASSPELVQMPERTRQVLEKLAASPKVVLAIVSGRRIEDVQAKSNVDAIYGGNHGLEISGPNIHFLHPEAMLFSAKLKSMQDGIADAIAPWPEAWVENKRWTATVHMRSVAGEHWPDITDAVAAAVGQAEDWFTLRKGHAAVEVIPRIGWDKGSAVHYLRRELALEDAVTVCLGDDRTDETMFAALPAGITIRVGYSEDTTANYYVESVTEATRVLELILLELEGSGTRRSSWRMPTAEAVS